MISVRPATLDELAKVHPEAVGISYRAWTAELDGEAVGSIGLAFTRPRACLFCGFDERLRPHLRSMPILRLLKKVDLLIKERGLPVYALRDRNEPQSPKILKRLGFRWMGEIQGDEIWGWEP